MAFEEYVARAPEVRVGAPADKITIAVTGKIKFTMGVVIGTSILKQMGWNTTNRFTFYFGTGEDKGKFLLKPAEKGLTMTDYGTKRKEGDTTSLKPGYIALTLKSEVNTLKEFCKGNIPRQVVEYALDVTSGGLVVDLPKGFFTESQPPS